MVRAATDVTSESDTERVQHGSTKKTYASKKRRGMSASGSDVEVAEKEVHEEPEETAPEGDGVEDEEEEEEEEYEIEKIIDAKKGQFPAGRMGYLVKWKNYEEEHNSWVDERDAGNAKELIDQFWAEKKKNKLGPRKSEPPKPKPRLVEKPSRKSLADMESESVDGHAKKRGRPKKDEPPSDKQETRDEDEDEDEDEQRAKKKPRKSNGLAAQVKRESEEEVVGNMKKHMKVSSWEGLIDTVDTVEREEDGELYVFFTLKDKRRVRENSRICAEKFPQKLIMFYESNLRWKTEEEPAEE